MNRPSSIAVELWDALPAELRPGIAAVVIGLEERIAVLEARLGQNSSNSSRPPSSDPPRFKPAPRRRPSGKRKGGQPGHRRAERVLLEPDVVVPLKPGRCRSCRQRLHGDDPHPLIRQVHEIPAVRPHVTEYRRHRLTCSRCGAVSCGELPVEARSGFGVRAQAVCAWLGGSGRLGKRMVSRAMQGLFGLTISPAAVCGLERKTAVALAPITQAAWNCVRGQTANVDETGWKQGRRKAWLWAAVTRGLSVFLIRRNRNRAAFEDLVGPTPGVLTTDRYSVYTHLPPPRRQVCWAHLRRDFQAMIDRNDAGSVIGEELLLHADLLFHAWHHVRDGTLSRRGFQTQYLSWLRPEVRALLERGAAADCAKTARVCRELLSLERALWTFAAVPDVEPTNNAAERAVRHAVCWRKTSHGTDSEAGSRFIERILTVTASCGQQGRNVLAFLTEAIQAARAATTPPSLLPNAA